MHDQNYYIILYDISNNKRRTALFKVLESYGAAYQFSVFEARLDKLQFVKLRHAIKIIINKKQDRVAVVRVCENCRGKAELLGTQKTSICQHVIVI